MTFTTTTPRSSSRFVRMMLTSREAVVNYMTPLGLAHIMATGHHYGPGPWVSNAGRPDWSPTYYHRADTLGIGFDRTATGSNAVAQYFPPVRDRFAGDAVPDSLLLWFHHVGWNQKLSDRQARCGRSWRATTTQASTPSARCARHGIRVKGSIDSARFADVASFLTIQEKEARLVAGRSASVLPDVLPAADSGGSREARASVGVLSALCDVRADPRQAAVSEAVYK